MVSEYLVIFNRRTRKIKNVRKQKNIDSYGIDFNKFLSSFPQDLHELATNLLDMYSKDEHNGKINLSELLLEIIDNPQISHDFNKNLEELHNYDLKHDLPIKITKAQLKNLQKYLNNSNYCKDPMNNIIIDKYSVSETGA